MNINIEESWKNILESEFEKDSFKSLSEFVKSEYKNYDCYPEKKNIFAAFNTCSFKDLKVVIIGQDPYHGKGQANGLCFAVLDGIPHPPSLKNIFKELQTDVGKSIPISGNLSSWAKQGVLLLNATLTVRANEAGSHQKRGWEEFTDAVIKQISEQKKQLIFLLWGKFAESKTTLIDIKKHQVFTAPHPSPLGAWRGWFGSKHFSKTNEYLKKNDLKEIGW
ncbi:MAG: uracil-DNA glycosylase [Gammaproteobacteria bacterium]|nr:uracil-DNA glycosylase [Gammaproteobacteria bacterium]MDG1509817.1 uracil-DNA glycosylase [Flavobacteriaceae bacterium]MDG2276191.1 uracil-DNA glycosylase [Flavobacteriaceae bacterium]